MLEFLLKTAYWEALDNPMLQQHVETYNCKMAELKNIQDLWVLSYLKNTSAFRIAEAGGGFGRVLRSLPGTERWNLDKHNGLGRTVTEKRRKMPEGIRSADCYLGDFSPDVPSDYFDVVFSISVIEHIPHDFISDFFQDCARILRPNGRSYHAIDFYLGDHEMRANEDKLDRYITAINDSGLRFLKEPAIQRPLSFKSSYASASDFSVYATNKLVPKLTAQRKILQSVSLCVI